MNPSLVEACEHASKIIAAGGVIAYPTEAVYGIGCDPLNQSALRRLLSLKERDDHKGLIVVAGAETHLSNLILPLHESTAATIRASWPGPVTWIVPAVEGLPVELTGGRSTLAVRVSTHPVIKSICGHLHQGIVSTSANLSSQPELRSAEDVRTTFGSAIDYVIDAPLGYGAATSQIIDAATMTRLR